MPREPLIELLRVVRRRMILADAGWLAVMSAFVIAIATVVMSLTLRLVPISLPVGWTILGMAAALTVAVFIGVWRRWPSEARVARHLDESLGLHELMASGLASVSEDSAERSVRAAANARAASIPPRSVRVDAPSSRVLAAAGLLIVGALVTDRLIQPTIEVEPPRERGILEGEQMRAARNASARPVRQSEVNATQAADESSPADTQRGSVEEESDGSNHPSVESHPRADSQRSRDSGGESRGQTNEPEGAPRMNQSSREDQSTNGLPLSDETGSSASSSGASSMRAGASPPRSAESVSTDSTVETDGSDRGRSGSHEADGSNAPIPDHAVAQVPDRYRALLCAYFDASGTLHSPTTRPGHDR